jgi:hypothetical protein
VPTHSLKTRALILCFVLALAGAIPLFAGGQKESLIQEANALITSKDYDAASLLLASIQREHPELTDKIQALQDQIYAVHEKSIVVEKKLTLARAAEDDVAMQSLLAELQQLDPKRAKNVSRSTAERVAFLRLMHDADALLAAGKPLDALAKYLLPLTDPVAAGFDMQKSEFDAARYSDLVVSSVRDGAARLRSSGEQELKAGNAVAAAPAAVSLLLAGALTTASPAQFEAAASPLRQASAAEGLVRAAAASLAQLNGTIGVAGGAQGNEAYLEYLAWLAVGHAGKAEGIAEAIRVSWEAGARAVVGTALARAASAFSEATRRYDSGDLGGADAAFQDAGFAGIIAAKAAGLAGSAFLTSPASGWALSAADLATARNLAMDALTMQERSSLGESYRTLIAAHPDFASLGAPDALPDNQITSVRSRLGASVDAAEGSAARWSARAGALTNMAAAGAIAADLPGYSSGLAAEFGSYAAELKKKDTAFGVQQAVRESRAFADTLASALKSREQGRDLVNGTRNGVQALNAPRKPNDAVAIYTDVSNTLSSLAGQITDSLAQWRSEKPWVTASPDLAALLKTDEALGGQVQSASVELVRLVDVAQTQHANYIARRKEADLAFTTANGELTRAAKDSNQALYDLASDDFKKAVVLYTETLVFEDDQVALSRATTEIDTLLRKITDATLAKRLDAVTAQVDAARKQFNGGEYLKSFNTLQAAQASWSLIYSDSPYTDLNNLMVQVRTALQASGGRDLDPTDSRATAVNGYVSIAYGKVIQAEALPKTSPQRSQLLKDAFATVQNALDIVPVYRTASVLKLRISKDLAQNDAQFNAQADSDIKAAVQAYTSGKLTAAKAYFQLKDYYDIRPSASLKDLLTSLEVKLGLRIIPISTTDVALSDQKYKEASDFYQTGTPESLDTAKSSLDQAIALNPSNAKALALRRTILLKLGSPEVNVLSRDDLVAFNNAQRLMQNAAYSDAFSLLDTLMNKGSNKTYGPLKSAWQLAKTKAGL